MKRTLIILVSLFSVFALIPGGGAARAGGLPFGPAAPPAVEAPQSSLGTAFTYQGVVKKDGLPYSGSCSFAFSLWDSLSGGLQVGSTLTQTLTVSDGLFNANLDFGAGRFNGQQRWLEIKVRCPAATGAYVSLGRQELMAAPYALYATGAPWSGITSRPAGLDDGDNDTLAGLSCASNQVPKWTGSAWACTNDALAKLSPTCGMNEVPKWTGSAWVCTPDALAKLSTGCTAGYVPKWNGANWRCQPDNDRLNGLACSPNQIPRWNGSAWVCSIDRIDWKNTLIVATSGGHYSSISGALTSINDARANNPYLIWVAPGVYTETFDLKPYVHLMGAGQEATIIRNSLSYNMGGGVVKLAAHTSLRDLTVENYGGGAGNIYTAVLARSGITDTLVMNVTARATGPGGSKQTVYVLGAGTDAGLLNVTALARGAGDNYALVVENGAHVRLEGGVYTATGGSNAWGIQVFNLAGLDAEAVSASGVGAAVYNYGLELYSSAQARLFGGEFRARAGELSIGINTTDSSLLADSVDVQAAQGTFKNTGLQSVSNTGTMTTTLRDSSLLATGGEFAFGAYRWNGQFISQGNLIRAQDASDNTIGFHNAGLSPYQYAGRLSNDRIEASAEAGWYIEGILNEAWLVADEVVAHAEDKLSADLAASVDGLRTTNGIVDLHGGQYQAEYGDQVSGITALQTSLKAWEVTALGSNAEVGASGLVCDLNSFCELWGGSYRGELAKSGTARGILVLSALFFTGRDFNAHGLAGVNSFGFEAPVPIPPNSINIYQAVLEGATNTVWAVPTPYTMVDIYNAQLLGGPVVPLPPAPPLTVQCTLTSRAGVVAVTTNTGPCP